MSKTTAVLVIGKGGCGIVNPNALSIDKFDLGSCRVSELKKQLTLWSDEYDIIYPSERIWSTFWSLFKNYLF